MRYIKVIGGPPGREGVLVGTRDGQVVKIFVNNPFSNVILKHTKSIRCLDMSMERRKVALVDESSQVVVYDVASKVS